MGYVLVDGCRLLSGARVKQCEGLSEGRFIIRRWGGEAIAQLHLKSEPGEAL